MKYVLLESVRIGVAVLRNDLHVGAKQFRAMGFQPRVEHADQHSLIRGARLDGC